MNIKQIRELAKILKENDLTAIEVEEGKVRIERNVTTNVVAMPTVNAPVSTVEQAPVASTPVIDPGTDFKDMKQVASPMVGVFYAAPAPGKPAFVKVGDKVKKGDVLCIVEAMKLMNEITAEEDGEVLDICAFDGDVVEFGQTLFKML